MFYDVIFHVLYVLCFYISYTLCSIFWYFLYFMIYVVILFLLYVLCCTISCTLSSKLKFFLYFIFYVLILPLLYVIYCDISCTFCSMLWYFHYFLFYVVIFLSLYVQPFVKYLTRQSHFIKECYNPPLIPPSIVYSEAATSYRVWRQSQKSLGGQYSEVINDRSGVVRCIKKGKLGTPRIRLVLGGTPRIRLASGSSYCEIYILYRDTFECPNNCCIITWSKMRLLFSAGEIYEHVNIVHRKVIQNLRN